MPAVIGDMLVQQIISVQLVPILSLFLLVVHVEIDIIMAKPYIPQKGLFVVQKFVCCNTSMITFDLHGYGGY